MPQDRNEVHVSHPNIPNWLHPFAYLLLVWKKLLEGRQSLNTMMDQSALGGVLIKMHWRMYDAFA